MLRVCSKKELDLYFRMWEYSKGAKGFNDWTIILTNVRFKTNHEENILSFVRFLKDYATLYGFKHLGVDDTRFVRGIDSFGLRPVYENGKNYGCLSLPFSELKI